MLVKQLLAMKGDSGKVGDQAEAIVTIQPEATLAEAAGILSERRIGAVVVSSDGKKPAGILSERDIVRQLGIKGEAALSTPISEVMTRDVQTCATGEDALAILERMTAGRFRHLPVVDSDGNMLGLISIGDAVSGRLKELAEEKEALTGMIMGN